MSGTAVLLSSRFAGAFDTALADVQQVGGVCAQMQARLLE
jgi:hypothetical protein